MPLKIHVRKQSRRSRNIEIITALILATVLNRDQRCVRGSGILFVVQTESLTPIPVSLAEIHGWNGGRKANVNSFTIPFSVVPVEDMTSTENTIFEELKVSRNVVFFDGSQNLWIFTFLRRIFDTYKKNKQ